jgi:hypothetical protein
MKSGVESQNGAPAMDFQQKGFVISEEADVYAPSFGLGQQFIARTIEEKQPLRD